MREAPLEDDVRQRAPQANRSDGGAHPTGATPPVVIDARGHRCPVPSLRLRRALSQAADGAVLTLIADDPMARIDVPHLLAQMEARLLFIEETEGVLTFTVAARS